MQCTTHVEQGEGGKHEKDREEELAARREHITARLQPPLNPQPTKLPQSRRPQNRRRTRCPCHRHLRRPCRFRGSVTSIEAQQIVLVDAQEDILQSGAGDAVLGDAHLGNRALELLEKRREALRVRMRVKCEGEGVGVGEGENEGEV